jgi:hypothetical protein
MQALKLPAIAGLIWVSAGFRLMFKQFLRLFSVVIVYFFAFLLVMALAVILGDRMASIGIDANWVQRIVMFIAGIFSPTLSIGFMEACRSITLGERVSPTYFLRGFQVKRPALLALVGLGLFQMVALSLVTAVLPKSPDMSLDDLLKAATAPNPPIDTSSTLLQVIVLIPLMLITAALWYAPMLIAWQDMKPAKAMFFSLVACWRNKLAFLMFAAGWFMVSIFLAMLTTVLYSALGSSNVTETLLAMILMVTFGAIYSSIYVSYSTVFVVLPTPPAERERL